MSDLYPSKPYKFVVRASVCERSFDRYADERDIMLGSFADSEAFPARLRYFPELPFAMTGMDNTDCGPTSLNTCSF